MAESCNGEPVISWQTKAALVLLVFITTSAPLSLFKAFAVTTTTSQQPQPPASAVVGQAAPEFQLQELDGVSVSLSDFRGHPSVLLFWTSWCSFCKAEAPQFNRLVRRYRAKGV